MDRDIGADLGERAIEFLRPQRLAAELGERSVLDPVARSGDRDQLDPRFVPAMRGQQGVGDEPRLGQRQRRSAGADTKGRVHAALVLAAPLMAGKPR